MDRRSLLKMSLALGSLGIPIYSLLASEPLWATPRGKPSAFSYAWLKGHARHLSSLPYQSHRGQLPDSLKNLSWDDYQALRFRPDKSLWQFKGSDFHLQFFHLGWHYQTPVSLYEVVDGQARELKYDPADFKYSGKAPLGSLSPDLGYAGFRVEFHTDFTRDVAAFLGASYFRAVGESMQYGLSARGLAIDTGLPGGEEFPVFTAFWLVKPKPGDGVLHLFALLDSPSTTGAYAFDIYPGRDMVMDIDVALYPRKAIKRLGLAPLTSMYLVGENDHRVDNDWRPEIHDSDGLSIWTGSGEWIWRPLINPPDVRVNSFFDHDPRGFGLLQRDRHFGHYQDDGVFYNRRPSTWVQPRGHWGAGAVMLVELPTDDETNDNIVAFWNPKEPFAPGKEHLLSYRLTWGAKAPQRPFELATTRATRTGIGGVVGQKRTQFSRRFVVDFAGGMLDMLGKDAQVEPVITASRGKIEITSARPLHSINGYRAMFDLVPDDSTDPIDLRLYLKLGSQPLTETWSYQYSPPPVNQRKLS